MDKLPFYQPGKNDIQILQLLEENYNIFDQGNFIEADPIQVPHSFSGKEDIEISALLAATLSWGNRKIIIRKARELIQRMDRAPYDFIVNASKNDLKVFDGFVHRTFNSEDCKSFISALQNIYRNYSGLRAVFENTYRQTGDIANSILSFRTVMLSGQSDAHFAKHLPNVVNSSACKRINMFLRWMVRKDSRGVDFGIWEKIPPSALMMPLDVHSGTIARETGLLSFKQNNWQAAVELTSTLRKFDPDDPVKYDFALFGLGVTGSGKQN